MIEQAAVADTMNFGMAGYAKADRETPAPVSAAKPTAVVPIREKARKVLNTFDCHEEPTYFHF
ncbi:MAG TPA: hypothetical protein PLO63_00725 [Syntrophales bacterium]|nr:hypothetical protein [Syntrophales bacterium]